MGEREPTERCRGVDPGAPTRATSGGATREAFEADFATVTFDYRGTGETGDATDAPMSTWSTRLFAQDAADVMTRLGHERFAVYGTSMGGRVAQMLAADHPEGYDRYSPMVSRLLHLLIIDVLATSVALRIGAPLQQRLQQMKDNLRAKRYT